jgi:hypothetical protein
LRLYAHHVAHSNFSIMGMRVVERC